ncbi:MAG: TIGR03985 family CRISPR-associated protein, partial [Cyanobacteria bacterium P01_F01_bin.86]
ASLPVPFRYGDLRARLFASSHGTADQATAATLSTHCQGGRCLCQRSLYALLSEAGDDLDWAAWQVGMAQHTGLPDTIWQAAATLTPFAVGHRSIRDDLKALVAQGWLHSVGRGQFCPVPPTDWPTWPDITSGEEANSVELSTPELWELLSTLEPIAFVQPNLEVLVNRLWEQATQSSSSRYGWEREPERRIFIHLDYILPPAMQEQVDTHQTQIEHLWRTHDGGVIQFDNWLARQERMATVTVYPVCLHYSRRAKYLSAYGIDPDGELGWHNYRLDRIRSERLRVLSWGEPAVPKALKKLRDRGELPTPAAVETALEEAWGFNFYLPRAWLLMRFAPTFARWYVDDTERHPTFERVEYAAVRSLITQHVPVAEQSQVWQVVEGRFSARNASRSPEDVYYAGWVRLGDINVVMRLRDWRPQGEVIAPWPLRQQMAAEARREVEIYGESFGRDA